MCELLCFLLLFFVCVRRGCGRAPVHQKVHSAVNIFFVSKILSTILTYSKFLFPFF